MQTGYHSVHQTLYPTEGSDPTPSPLDVLTEPAEQCKTSLTLSDGANVFLGVVIRAVYVIRQGRRGVEELAADIALQAIRSAAYVPLDGRMTAGDSASIVRLVAVFVARVCAFGADFTTI